MMAALFQAMADFHFIRPWWLLGCLLAVGLFVIFRRTRAASSLDHLVDAHLQSAVVASANEVHSGWSLRLSVLGVMVLSVALAGPAWERLPQPLYQLQQGRVVVLSLSTSMDRRDMQPSRLQRARFKVDDLLSSLPGVLTGLVGFAGEAFVVAPLSDDQDTISNLLQSLDSSTLPVQGFRAERGLQKAAELLKQVSIDGGEIVLVTDQASPLAVGEAAKLAGQSIRVSVLEVAPSSDQSQRGLLRSIARSGNGVYSLLTANQADLQRINAPLQQFALQAEKTKSTQQGARQADQWRDRGPWLLLPLLLLVSLLFRRGGFLAALSPLFPLGVVLALGGAPNPAYALDWGSAWQSLWQTKEQQQWAAAEAYRRKELAQAEQGFAKDTSAVGAYNQGNVLAQSGQLEEALAAYDQALALDPQLEDARYNRAVVQQAMAQQQTEQNQAQQDSQNAESGDQQGEQQNGETSGDNGGSQGDGEQTSERSNSEAEPQAGQPQGSQNEERSQDKQPQSAQGESAQESEASPASAIGDNQPGDEAESATLSAASEGVDTADTDGSKEASLLAQDRAQAERLGEEEQALQLMLRQVPDNPGALLQRKFKYQYQNRAQKTGQRQ